MYEKYKLRSRWCKMLSRCEDEDNPQYKDYGGRGVLVCEEWHDFGIFFLWCLSNDFSPEKQLDRINNNGNYKPQNCRFVSSSENNRNKRTNKMLSIYGEIKTMIDWSEDDRCNVTYYTLMQRVLRGWEPEKALTVMPNDTRSGKIPHNAILIEAWGEYKTVTEWIQDDRCVYKRPQGIWERLNKFNWPAEKALSQPPGKGRPRVGA